MSLQTKNFADLLTFSRASTGTYFDNTGTLQTAAVNAPRFDYDPVSKAALGLLIEESRTNLLTYSEQFDNAAWGETHSSVTANVASAPDGNVTADKLVEDTAAASHAINYASGILLNSGTNYTVSVFLKAAGRNWAFLDSYDGSLDHYAYFDLSAGVVGNVGASTTATIENCGSGWYKCSISFTSANTTTTAFAFQVFTATANGLNNYTGDGASGIYMWGAQLEAGAFATSYIPTTSAAVTRAADVCTRTLGTEWNPSAGTFVVKYTSPNYANIPSVLNFDGAWTNGLNVQGPPGNAGWWNGTNNIPTTNTIAAGLERREAFAYTNNSRAICLNGGSVASDSSAPFNSSPTAMRLGDNPTGTQCINGHIKSLVYYPTRLSDADLQSLTA
ncbi:MAG: hypothetical protein KGL25_03160 [Gammaproteobacteria bacterium]|nr:hypothetical protein [Gammaproteobacteria bacterium]